MTQRTATTAAGLELGSDDAVDGTIGFDGKHSCDPPVGVIAMPHDLDRHDQPGRAIAFARSARRVSRQSPAALHR